MPENTDPPPAPIESLTVHRKLFESARRRQGIAVAWGSALTTLWGFGFGVFVTRILPDSTPLWVGGGWLVVQTVLIAGLFFVARSVARAENRSMDVFDSAVKFVKNRQEDR